MSKEVTISSLNKAEISGPVPPVPPDSAPASHREFSNAVDETIAGTSNSPPPLPAIHEPESSGDHTALITGIASGLFSLQAAYWVASCFSSAIVNLVFWSCLALFVFAPRFDKIEFEPITVNGSLAEENVDDDRPAFEQVAELDLGSGQNQSTIQQISGSLQAVKDGLQEAAPVAALPSFSAGNNEQENDGGDFLFKLPEAGLAVTKGSFTAWTVPESPEVNRPYMIIIEVRLPDGISSYRVNDLRGSVRGTDGYRQTIPFDSNAKYSSFYTNEEKKLENISGSEVIKVRNNKIQLAIQVPGAKKLVRDVIEIRSTRLREKQQLELVFGSSREE